MMEPKSAPRSFQETPLPTWEITFRLEAGGLKDMAHNATVHDTDLLCIAAWCMTAIRDNAINADYDRASRILADITGDPAQSAGQG